MSEAAPRIEELPGAVEDSEVSDMLVELALDEQEHWDHPRETADELRSRLRPAATFTGENHLMLARDADGTAIGLCWVVLFDPGTGLEGEIAELYVRPSARGRGIATALARAGLDLMRRHHVTFASVWTRADNPAALAVYRAAGFSETAQRVLTWLPLERSGSGEGG